MFRFRPRVYPLPASTPPLPEALSRLRDRRGLAFLDSAAGEPRRFSLLAFDPLPLAPPARLRDLRGYLGALEPAGGDEPPAFAGGFLGALSYDLGSAEEELALPRDPWRLPLVLGGLYTDYLVRDHVARRTWLVLGDAPGDGRPDVATRRRELAGALAAPHPSRAEPRARAELVRLVPTAEHVRRIEAVRAEIERGEIYQANLSHRFEARVDAHPVDLYLALRAAHPGPYLGAILGEGCAVLSGSPELLLEVGAEGDAWRARTSPIKGTASRDDDPGADTAAARELLASAKDLAELAMIVDLERNDLGRVAASGGVRVDTFPRLESYTTVHHLVADVSARLASGKDALDALLAVFPGGSITGAPKLRSMEVIAALEGEGRGFAYGSLAALDTRGRLWANVLIRTLVWRAPDEVTYRVGGGITHPSNARDEEAEALAKGRALAQLFGGRPVVGALR